MDGWVGRGWRHTLAGCVGSVLFTPHNLPASQLPQVRDAEELNFPASQLVQVGEAATMLYLPASQSVQTSEMEELNLPAAQFEQDDEASPLYFPASQMMQA